MLEDWESGVRVSMMQKSLEGEQIVPLKLPGGPGKLDEEMHCELN